MNTHKVVIKKMNSKRSLKTRELLGKSVCKPCKSPHVHSHGKVLPFHERGGNALADRVAGDRFDGNADTIGRRITMLALNNLIFINCLQRDLLSDKRRYYFNPKVLRTKESNTFAFPSLKGRASERTKIYVQKTGGRLEYKHHAVQLQLIRDLDNWYLEIDADWYFTFPYNKQATRKEIGIRITKEKANTHNGDYRYALHFWKQYLSNNDTKITFPCDNVTGRQSLVASAEYQTLVSDYLLFNDYDGPRQFQTAG